MSEIRYAKIINEETHEAQVGVGCPDEYYVEIGMTEMEVEQAYNGRWYVKGFAPKKPEPTRDEISQIRAQEYQAKVDPITAHISRLRDKEQTEEIIVEIACLMSDRDRLVEQIKAKYPYPDEPDNGSGQVEQEPKTKE